MLEVGEDGLIRLQKLLAQSGVASRRACEELMLAGRVEVDGEVITRLGTKVDPRSAVVRVDGQRLPPISDSVYLAFNKPRGVVSTMSDPHGRPTLADLLGDRAERLFHVGRLDTDTEGLILLTNHGELAHRLAHPSYGVDKTYVAQVGGVVKPATVRRLLEGIELDDGLAAADAVVVKSTYAGRSIVELSLHEGRNRIVRRMLDAVGHPVQQLTRTAFGVIRLRDLKVGSSRELSREELGALLDGVGL
jgi:23S rRNA pseudouridine2605 synthase